MKEKGKKKKKKDSQLVLRLEKEERDSFVSLCEQMDTTAAREIRRFMRDFVEKNRGVAAKGTDPGEG